MRSPHFGTRPWRPLGAVSFALALAACNAITGGKDQAFATVKGTVTFAAGTPFSKQSVAVVCPVIGRGQFGNSTTTDASGGYSIDIDVPSRFIDDVKFTNYKMPCDMYAPATNGRSPDSTLDIPFGSSQASAPVTTVNFITKE